MAGGLWRREGATHGEGRAKHSDGAAHEFKGEEREAVFRWRSTVGRLGKTGDDADERDRLLGVVARLGEDMLLRKRGDVGKVMWASGGELFAPHTDVDRVKKCFWEQRKVDKFALLEQLARVGVPVDVGTGGNPERELAYGNHGSARKHVAEVWENAVGDAKKGRAIVMPVRAARSVRSLQINHVGAVGEKGKRRIVHDSTFSSEPEQRGGGAVG